MKESVGITQLYALVVVLIILFAGIMAFAINRANSFAIKDKIVNILEKHDGFDLTHELIGGMDYSDCDQEHFDDALEEIVCSLQELSYRQTGVCPEFEGNVEVVGYQRNGTKTTGNNKSSFCIVKQSGNASKSGVVNMYYYQVIVFYHLDLPIVRQLFSFKNIGQTKALYQ
ncbi:MAG: hypothetical protein IKR74_05395 [Bacilli bacterium]|nr:hypothetical protein [Bacilli bacterium]